ncbi:MAG: hypothetical protein A3H02_02105 [Candidatus Niyogibacteria bacterium RIFCSPLOWO2_12_FULL_41_13]|uniref:UDP-N-acetylmuramoyl-tripeptide--D-alanyl-D-alanine ligase n=1 Tax=Candidatus Niyogibacteria bacterium RIFCSPLOWO2_12_FULL_41_13 TaxID=1801726 RepID=A0A1G2F5B3_9BACT|nr:MAG: hypothetical protein A3H02_02105 [Candidatus Niyogibacteria bacterium RIFCSPLOWO2_12_FULL_41_13]
MKNFFKKIIIRVLNFESRIILFRFKPLIIAITGTVGKTSTKEAVCAVLKPYFDVRKSEKSYNSEIGVPLTILGLENAGKSFFYWFKNMFLGARKCLFSFSYPEILILEYGLDRPGDIGKLIKLAPPKIGIFTAVGKIPVHVEFFAGSEEIAKEKGKLIENLPADGFAILNYDDMTVLDYREKTRAKVITYGFGEGANIKASNYRLILKEAEEKIIPEGISFKVDYNGSNVPLRIFGGFGKSQVYAILAGLAVGVAMDLNLIELVGQLAQYAPPAGRLKLIEGIKQSYIIDDTYNASPMATHEALDLLKDLPAKRKIAVLGDMLELGRFTEQAHRAVGEKTAKIADLIFTFGGRAKFIADEAGERGFEKNKIFSYLVQEDLIKELKYQTQEGDLILVKGSQLMRMERIVKNIMAHPEQAKELLVRQDWEDT